MSFATQLIPFSPQHLFTNRKKRELTLEEALKLSIPSNSRHSIALSTIQFFTSFSRKEIFKSRSNTRSNGQKQRRARSAGAVERPKKQHPCTPVLIPKEEVQKVRQACRAPPLALGMFTKEVAFLSLTGIVASRDFEVKRRRLIEDRCQETSRSFSFIEATGPALASYPFPAILPVQRPHFKECVRPKTARGRPPALELDNTQKSAKTVAFSSELHIGSCDSPGPRSPSLSKPTTPVSKYHTPQALTPILQATTACRKAGSSVVRHRPSPSQATVLSSGTSSIASRDEQSSSGHSKSSSMTTVSSDTQIATCPARLPPLPPSPVSLPLPRMSKRKCPETWILYADKPLPPRPTVTPSRPSVSCAGAAKSRSIAITYLEPRMPDSASLGSVKELDVIDELDKDATSFKTHCFESSTVAPTDLTRQGSSLPPVPARLSSVPGSRVSISRQIPLSQQRYQIKGMRSRSQKRLSKNLHPKISGARYKRPRISRPINDSTVSLPGYSHQHQKRATEGTAKQLESIGRTIAQVTVKRLSRRSFKPLTFASLSGVLDQCNKRGSTATGDSNENTPETVSARVAEKVVLSILQMLDTYQDLFAAATITRGFYRVFQRHKLHILKRILRKRSPAAWAFRNLLLAEHRGTVELQADMAAEYMQYHKKDYEKIKVLRALILTRCEKLLCGETISGLEDIDRHRSLQLDEALWRIWMFCQIFGRDTGRQNELESQVKWLKGESVCLSKNDQGIDEPAKTVRTACLSAKQLHDMLELWTCMTTLLDGFLDRTAEARSYGVFANHEHLLAPSSSQALPTIARQNLALRRLTPPNLALPPQKLPADIITKTAHETILLKEWTHYVLTLGPAVLLPLATTSSFPLARAKGVTTWPAPPAGTSRAGFLKAALVKVYSETAMTSPTAGPFGSHSSMSSREGTGGLPLRNHSVAKPDDEVSETKVKRRNCFVEASRDGRGWCEVISPPLSPTSFAHPVANDDAEDTKTSTAESTSTEEKEANEGENPKRMYNVEKATVMMLEMGFSEEAIRRAIAEASRSSSSSVSAPSSSAILSTPGSPSPSITTKAEAEANAVRKESLPSTDNASFDIMPASTSNSISTITIPLTNPTRNTTSPQAHDNKALEHRPSTPISNNNSTSTSTSTSSPTNSSTKSPKSKSPAAKSHLVDFDLAVEICVKRVTKARYLGFI